MELFVPKESKAEETRTALIPAGAEKLVDLGVTVKVEAGTGARSDYGDTDYTEAGATVASDRTAALATADIVLRVNEPSLEEIEGMKSGGIHVSFLDPFNEKELIEGFSRAGVTAVSMEMMPRTTIAQKMDALSSQANLAGYSSVITAVERLNRILPMMMTPAGTIAPARVFVIGVGVAGLQAIATAKRLGARVDAFDTRPVVEEQVKSLGAKFVKIDLGETGQTEQGYARALTPEQLEMQRKGMAKVCAQSDIVITTAKLFGRKAPIIVNAEMVAGMKLGSIIVDLAAESGGNVEGTRVNEEVVTANGVRIIGIGSLEGKVPHHASQVYSANLCNFIEHFWDKENNAFRLDLDNEILKGCVITHGGEIVHEQFQDKAAT
jgi:NAD(P) transhydrogenase subunit alpha